MLLVKPSAGVAAVPLVGKAKEPSEPRRLPASTATWTNDGAFFAGSAYGTPDSISKVVRGKGPRGIFRAAKSEASGKRRGQAGARPGSLRQPRRIEVGVASSCIRSEVGVVDTYSPTDPPPPARHPSVRATRSATTGPAKRQATTPNSTPVRTKGVRMGAKETSCGRAAAISERARSHRP